MTASTTPSTMPITMAATVTQTVSHTPFRICEENRYFQTVDQSHAGLVRKLLTSIPANSSRTAAETHRQGWRCGIALIGSGASLAGTVGSVTVVIVLSSSSRCQSTGGHSLTE